MGRLRNIFLLIVSYLLYLQWKPVYALILIFVTLVTYFTSKLIPHTPHPKRVLTIGVLVTLFPLFFFKYYNFINDNINELMTIIGIKAQMPGLNWAIPIGISFYSLQALSYVWDVYYKRHEPENEFLTYALYVSFFPCILSGPINRASLILPQLKKSRHNFDYEKAVSGLKLLLWGMFMKVVVADRLALYVDTVLGDYINYTGLSCLLASFFYTLQIYADFAGYSLMAIGVGRTLGFELTKNFNRPYFAVSITDFWHRWHISLSTWLRDYVYIPLGGSRCSKIKNYLNIFITFFISGIWHGANWTFIVWGCIHGISQIVEKILGLQECKKKGLIYMFRIVITLFVVNFAWVFFRMPSIPDACALIGRIFDFNLPLNVYLPNDFSMFFIVIAVVILFFKDLRDEFFPHSFLVFDNQRKFIRWLGYIAVICYILTAGVFGADQFIYANF